MSTLELKRPRLFVVGVVKDGKVVVVDLAKWKAQREARVNNNRPIGGGAA